MSLLLLERFFLFFEAALVNSFLVLSFGLRDVIKLIRGNGCMGRQVCFMK